MYPVLLRMNQGNYDFSWDYAFITAGSTDHINPLFGPVLCGYSPCRGLGIAVRYWHVKNQHQDYDAQTRYKHLSGQKVHLSY